MITARDLVAVLIALAVWCWIAYHVGFMQGQNSVSPAPAVVFNFPGAALSSSNDLWLPPGGKIVAQKGGTIVVKKEAE